MSSRYELVRFVDYWVRVGPSRSREGPTHFFSVVGQEFCQIPLLVWALSQDILYACSWGNIGSLACAYVRIYDGCTISRCIIDMTGEVLEEENDVVYGRSGRSGR